MMLSKKKKEQAEKIARANFEYSKIHFSSLGSERERLAARKNIAQKWTKEDIEALKDGFGQQYGSVFTTILISLMLKFAMRLIERWIEKKLNDLLD